VIEVRRAVPDEWDVVREVRLRALADAPYAFASTLERELAFDEQEWRRRIGGGPWFLASDAARDDGRAVGVVAGYTEDGATDERHLVAMWVEPERRGSTAGAELVEAVCRWAGDEGATALTLWLADGNPRARRFYERLGFATTGRRQPLPSAPDVDEELLRRSLPTS
jgi:GNAT superfamily N-acetyltransferase